MDIYEVDYAAIKRDEDDAPQPNPRKLRRQIIVAISGTAALMVGLIWFMFAGIKIIFPDYVAGEGIIKAGGKYVYTDNHSIFYKGNIEDAAAVQIIKTDCESNLLSNGKTVFYITGNRICSVELDGKNQKTVCDSENAVTLVHCYHDLLYYISQTEKSSEFLLYSVDLKTGERAKIDGFSTATDRHAVYKDKLYYYGALFCVYEFDFKTLETRLVMNDAGISCDIGHGEEPLLLRMSGDADAYVPTAIYKPGGEEPELVCELPEDSQVECAKPGQEQIVILNKGALCLFNTKTAEKTELKTGAATVSDAVVTADWNHPEQVYVGTGSEVWLIRDGMLKACTVESGATLKSGSRIIDGNIVNEDNAAHKITVNENVQSSE